MRLGADDSCLCSFLLPPPTLASSRLCSSLRPQLQSGEAATNAGFIDRARHAVGQKIATWQGKETPAELKKMLAMLAELTPEEKTKKTMTASEKIQKQSNKSDGSNRIVVSGSDLTTSSSCCLFFSQ